MREAERARAAMVDHGESVGLRAAERAIERLEASGDLDTEQREAVEELAGRLVTGLLAGPLASIDEGDSAAVAAAVALFGDDAIGPAQRETDRARATD